MKDRVINISLQTLLLLLCAVVSMDVAFTEHAAQARNKAFQFLNNRQRDVLSTAPLQLTLVHAEKSRADATLADYYVFNADDGSAFVIVAGDDRAAHPSR